MGPVLRMVDPSRRFLTTPPSEIGRGTGVVSEARWSLEMQVGCCLTSRTVYGNLTPSQIQAQL